jgi:hypothetical protein
MTTLGDGLYTIRKAPELATLQSVKPGTDVVLRPASDDPREFPDQRVGSFPTPIHKFVLTTFFPCVQWVVKKTPNGTHTIVNRENSLSFEGKPERHTRVRGYPNHPPREWVLYKAAEPNTYL